MECFTEYRNVVAKIKGLASDITSLKQSQWEELARLNQTRSNLNSAIINAVQKRNTALEESAAILAEHIKEARQALARTESPECTTDDVMALEAVWQESTSLFRKISGLLVTRPTDSATCTGPQVLTPETPAETDGKGKGPEQPDISDKAQTFTGKSPSCTAVEVCPAVIQKEVAAALDKTTGGVITEAGNTELKSRDVPITQKTVIPSKKNKKSKNDKHPKKEMPKITAISVMPARIMPYENGDILPEEIKRNVEAIKLGKR
ncbi:MAG: hypothetical protein VR69_10890 [Peptococcaceae bacterium BRH_c4b]|nr:MAG: hypothetical protein VR69_10890 [Peptococcaceae bacterium BRH_c4b]